ncbi:hypothetical protein NKG94_31440 [Micromonospora sp. M12]
MGRPPSRCCCPASPTTAGTGRCPAPTTTSRSCWRRIRRSRDGPAGHRSSSRPPAGQVTVDSNVDVIHHVIQELRRGTPGGHAFDQVVTVGHAFGSGLAVVEAARHADVDALVLTSMLHTVTPTYREMIGPCHSAAQDPVIGDPNLPEWYLTQRPGLRARLFEYAGGIDRRLSAHDELIKSTATLGEGQSLSESTEASIRRRSGARCCWSSASTTRSWARGTAVSPPIRVRCVVSNGTTTPERRSWGCTSSRVPATR